MPLMSRLSPRVKKILLSVILHSLAVIALLVVMNGANSVIQFGITGHKGANVYYDATHGARHLWNRDNRRHRVAYHTVSGFSRFFNALKDEGYRVHAETSDCFNRSILDKYDIFFVGEQTYHARFMTDTEQKNLIDWVKDGGSLFALIEHTNAHYMEEVFNQLFKDLPVKARIDSIADLNQTMPLSPTWVDMPIIGKHPVTKGVKEYRFYNGGSLDTKHGVLFSSKTSWSDRANESARPIHNGNKTRDPDELSGPLAGAAAFTHGKGKVVVISDHNAMSNPTMYWGDHYRFVMNSMDWLAGAKLNLDVVWIGLGLGLFATLFVTKKRWVPLVFFSRSTIGISLVSIVLVVLIAYWSKPASYDFFVHTGNQSAMKYMTKRSGGFFTLYGQWTKEPQLRPWASRTLKSGYDGLILSAPRVQYSEKQLKIIDGYLSRGKTVAYLATIDSLESEAGTQLRKKFEFDVQID